jgi:hypothetical protein
MRFQDPFEGAPECVVIRLENLVNLLPLSFGKIKIVQSLPTKTAQKTALAAAVPLRRSHGKGR